MTMVLTLLRLLTLVLLLLDVAVCSPMPFLSNKLNLLTITTASLASAFPEELGLEKDDDATPGSRHGRPANKRRRRSVASMFCEQGSNYVRRAHRMHDHSFWKLLTILQPCMKTKDYNNQKPKRGAANGFTSAAARLSSALRCFAGGRPDDIALVHGISHTAVFESVWEIVDAVNDCTALETSFPKDHAAQKQIAAGFKANSRANFDNVAGAIDGMLVWTEKPHLRDCDGATVGPKKFFCGRKKKFGLNLQGVCDYEGRFLDVSIGHPASTADWLCFKTQSLYDKLENEEDFLSPGLVLFGDNAYVNTTCMATPFKAVRSGEKDDYNFYHSQVCHATYVRSCLLVHCLLDFTHLCLLAFVCFKVRIEIECAFGMFVSRWGLLRRALPATMGLKKICRLVMCLARLHNFCINERVGSELPPLPVDAVETSAHGGIPLERNACNDSSPEQLLHGGDHFDDVDPAELRRIEARARRTLQGKLPRDHLVAKVVAQDLKRPTPAQWK